jgi:hypothetical protein
VRELEYLSNKYGEHLTKVVPSITNDIKAAKARIQLHGLAARAGAPRLWIQGQLVRLWRIVRALQIANPKLDDLGACRLLAREGFWVYEHDPRSSIAVEDVRVLVKNSTTLRRRLAEAKKSLRGHDEVIQELDLEASELSKHPRIQAVLNRRTDPNVRGI